MSLTSRGHGQKERCQRPDEEHGASCDLRDDFLRNREEDSTKRKRWSACFAEPRGAVSFTCPAMDMDDGDGIPRTLLHTST